MLTIFSRKDNELHKSSLKDFSASGSAKDILWLDMVMPDETERKEVEKLISMNLLTRRQAQEIESTSKYYETDKAVIANSNIFMAADSDFIIIPASFIITKDGMLVSQKYDSDSSFPETMKRIMTNPSNNSDGYDIFLTFLETLIDHNADLAELMTGNITRLSKDISGSEKISKEVIKKINRLQEQATSLRENIFDIQRVLSGVARSDRFRKESKERVVLMLRDIDSLINHSDISFQRLDYLQDTAMGLINIEQNEVVKILSVAAVIFMPPTLIASIYGMNFKVMPELDWVWTASNGWVIPAGYIFALVLMLLVTFITYWFFRYKKWL